MGNAPTAPYRRSPPDTPSCRTFDADTANSPPTSRPRGSRELDQEPTMTCDLVVCVVALPSTRRRPILEVNGGHPTVEREADARWGVMLSGAAPAGGLAGSAAVSTSRAGRSTSSCCAATAGRYHGIPAHGGFRRRRAGAGSPRHSAAAGAFADSRRRNRRPRTPATTTPDSGVSNEWRPRCIAS